MMKRIFFFFLLFVAIENTFGQGIEFFHGTWSEAIATAQNEKKPIFVDAFTTWCGPCKFMAANVFTVDSVGDYYNQNFINYKYDMEKGDGPEFAKTYRVTAYPTLLYLDENGKVLHRTMGARQPSDFIKEAERAKVVFDYK